VDKEYDQQNGGARLTEVEVQAAFSDRLLLNQFIVRLRLLDICMTRCLGPRQLATSSRNWQFRC